MVALLRSTDGNPDSRFEKYVNFLETESVPYITMCWDRFNKKTSSSNKLYYKKKSKYGQRFKNVTGLLGFNWFLLKNLIKKKKDYKIIHAADFDTILPAMIMKFLFGKKVIYDIYDWYIDSRSVDNSALKWIIKQMERINVKKSDVVIICEEGRRTQILFTPKRLWILPNIPNLNQTIVDYSLNGQLTISYVGILGAGRGLHNLIKLAGEKANINFIIGGFGPLEKDFIEASKLPNVDFRGRVSYDEALQIMSASDLIYAMYERVNPNHILAAPNKYYEGLALGKPIITTVGTLVGDKVALYDTGYCIDEKYDTLSDLVNTFTTSDMSNKAKNSTELWEIKYKEYVNRFMKDTYLKFIQS